MNLGTIIILAGAVLILLLAAGIIQLKRPKKLKTDRFIASWRELQTLLRDPKEWPRAVIEADKLLDFALKRRKLKGKTMGARMVSAQRLFTDNDDTWFAHNLAKKLVTQQDIKLKEADVKDALVGFRQALRDIGALPTTGPEIGAPTKEQKS